MLRNWTMRGLWASFLVVLTLATGAVGLSVLRGRSAAIADGVRDAHNIATVLGGQIARSIQSVDIVLRNVQRMVDESGLLASTAPLRPADLQAFRAALLQHLATIPQALQIVLTDERGQLVATNGSWTSSSLDFSDREFFRELVNNDGLSISPPLISRFSGEAVIVLARRIRGPDGAFLGAVSISLKKGYFEAIYRAIDTLPDETFELLRRDGTVLVRYPETREPVGQRVSAGSSFEAVVAEGGGSYRSGGPPDQVARWVAVEPIKDYPLVVNLAIPERVLLSNWRAHASVATATTLGLLICALVLLAIIARQFRTLSVSQSALQKEHEQLLMREAELQTQNQRFDAALNNMGQGLLMVDDTARLLVCNDRYRNIYGLSQEQTRPGTPVQDLFRACQQSVGFTNDVEKYQADFLASVSRRAPSLLDLACKDGRIIQISRHPMQNGGWVVTHEDITERRSSETKVAFLAHNDVLTGIPNRARFIQLIGESQQRLQKDNRPFSVLMLDLDRFKQINDSLGHATGDVLLKETAKRLRASLRETDTVARLGGDEFAVIQLPPREFDLADDSASVMRESAIVLANRIIALLGQPFEMADQTMFIGASIGIAMAPQDGIEPDDLMRKADLALYRAKSDGGNGYRFFCRELAEMADERQKLEAAMRAGISRGEFELHYQPQIDLITGRPRCMEGLVRWHHPERDLIMPGRFIPLAEDAGLVTPLGEYVLQRACADALHWPPDVKVGINVSPIQFQKSNLFDVVMCALVESGLPPERLEIEITERVLLEHETEHIITLHQLKSIGVSIALDDFGSGYSSLSYLTVFPFDKIKIDQSFTERMLDRPDCASIVGAIVSLGRSLDLLTVAEGVETVEQLEALRAAGITSVQGFLFGRPVPPSALQFDAVAIPQTSRGPRRMAN